jgi:D-aminoacyl-tRNA deacylase
LDRKSVTARVPDFAPMRAVVQRVSRASVSVGSEVVGEVGPGLLVLVGVAPGDDQRDALALADKLVGLRVFADGDGKMNLSVSEIGGGILVVSQFTLYGDTRKGRRPSFVAAALPEVAEPIIQIVAGRIQELGVEVATGQFGAMMAVDLVNDGPVTLVLEIKDGRVV